MSVNYIEHLTSIYTSRNSTVAKIEFEDEPASIRNNSPVSASFRPSRLNRFLNDLTLRPNDSPRDIDEPSLQKNGATKGISLSGSSLIGLPNLSKISMATSESTRNPEADSFAYMEILLESLAVLGKLGSALDNVAQRLFSEVFALVETTLEEVAERAEYSKGGSVLAGTGSIRSEGTSDPTAGMSHGIMPQSALLDSSCLRLPALESPAKEADHEILNDFFWTVYSKLDAVSQGLRVIYEVANRIGSVSDSSNDSSMGPGDPSVNANNAET
jgi:exocyst complex component 4